MEDKERRIVSFQVSGEELETIEIAAANQGVSRSEYLRTKVLSARSATPRPHCSVSKDYCAIWFISPAALTLRSTQSLKLRERYRPGSSAKCMRPREPRVLSIWRP
jgi:hypothetical protein